ncbi:MAG: YihY family inner membrane protein [Rikenellaceae bacterium]|nr:YihY family inner membrane protein [Rikenellaceae bacterium]MCL2692653.1 YihY family inner membrane protein [Rikenellaceae bacterium]
MKKIKEYVAKREKHKHLRNSWVVRPFRIALYTVRGIGEHDIFLRASALTYYTLLSLVPIAALIFGFMKGFGFDARLWEWLYGRLPEYSASLDQLQTWVENMLVRTRGGLIAAVGMVVFFWAVIRVFTNVESAFNIIWEVRKRRSIGRMLSDYLAVIVIAPILLISASSLSSFVRGSLEPWVWTTLLDVAFALAELVLVWLLFTLIYKTMPNTRVKFRGAVIAALIAGTVFWGFQKLYFLVQGELNSYNAVYGTFAALPLLFVWMQTSWMIVLVGAELSFAYQNIDRYDLEREAVFINNNNKRKILVATMLEIVRHFMHGDGPVASHTIADDLNLPVRSVREVVHELEKAGLVAAVKTPKDNRENAYIPARDVHDITIYDVVNGVENQSTAKLDISELPELRKVSKLLDDAMQTTKTAGMEAKLADLL